MPTVATVPTTCTHSCDFAYFNSGGMFDMGSLSQGGRKGSIRFSKNRFWHYHCRRPLATNLNFDRRLRGSGLRRDVTHADANSQRRTLRPAGHVPQLRPMAAAAPDRVV